MALAGHSHCAYSFIIIKSDNTLSMDLLRLQLRHFLVYLGMPVLPPSHVSELYESGLTRERGEKGGWASRSIFVTALI
jgi:hypothetical protein